MKVGEVEKAEWQWRVGGGVLVSRGSTPSGQGLREGVASLDFQLEPGRLVAYSGSQRLSSEKKELGRT